MWTQSEADQIALTLTGSSTCKRGYSMYMCVLCKGLCAYMCKGLIMCERLMCVLCKRLMCVLCKGLCAYCVKAYVRTV